MSRFVLASLIGLLALTQVEAAWYWPFGSDDEKAEPRLSELLEPASRFIDSAADYADEGKVDEAVADYRKALDELARIELENPERASRPEFASVRNKRAYIESAIDSLLLTEAQRNAKAVAVTDTRELEKRYAEEQAARAAAKANQGKVASDRGRDPAAAEEGPKPVEEAKIEEPREQQVRPVTEDEDEAEKTVAVNEPAPAPPPAAAAPRSRRERMMLARDDYSRRDYAAAMLTLKELLLEKPNDAAALNLRAMVEKASGDVKAAEATLQQLIHSNPNVYYGYYNLAKLLLETRGVAGKEQAKRYYETARTYYKGPVDRALEEKLK